VGSSLGCSPGAWLGLVVAFVFGLVVVAKIEVRVSDLSEGLIRNMDEAVTIDVEHPEYPETIMYVQR
jgi:hypothetical protein